MTTPNATHRARYGRVLAYFIGTPWAILPAKLEELKRILWARIQAAPLSPELFTLNIPAAGGDRQNLRADWERLNRGRGNAQAVTLVPRAAEGDEGEGDEPPPPASVYAVGDRVRVGEGFAHAEGDAGAVGEVVEISDRAPLGIQFDGRDGVTHWYTDTELVPEGSDEGTTPPTEPSEADEAAADARTRYRRPGIRRARSFRTTTRIPAAQLGAGGERPYTLAGGVAVIDICGTISPRPTLFDEYSGGTSHEAIGRATDAALADGGVEAIIYNIDSPGGVIFGMPETADKVFEAGKVKKTYAVANHVAASAGYWYMSQVSKAYVTPAGTVGSIGVLMGAVDETKALEQAGIRDLMVSNTSSPYKSEGYPQVAITDEFIQDMVRSCDKYMVTFVDHVARGRGTQPDRVTRDFGRGRMLLADDALAAGMVDGITTIDALVNDVNGPRTRAARREIAAKLAGRGLPLTGKKD